MADKRGILGQKIGMTQIWDEQNRAVPVTVIQAGPCRVVQVKTPERDGYSAIQLAPASSLWKRRMSASGLPQITAP